MLTHTYIHKYIHTYVYTYVERECCLLVLNLVSSTLPCIRQPGHVCMCVFHTYVYVCMCMCAGGYTYIYIYLHCMWPREQIWVSLREKLLCTVWRLWGPVCSEETVRRLWGPVCSEETGTYSVGIVRVGRLDFVLE